MLMNYYSRFKVQLFTEVDIKILEKLEIEKQTGYVFNN